MIESEEAESGETREDPVVQALTTLSDVAASSADDLIGLNEDLAVLRNHRVRGRSWHRIISDDDAPNPLSSLTSIATNFARASGGFRRALAVGLRKEGMQVTEIAALFGVSRQRVSALIRPRGQGESEDRLEQSSWSTRSPSRRGPYARPMLLAAEEARVLGSLVEKELTTPDQYPLTIKSLLGRLQSGLQPGPGRGLRREYRHGRARQPQGAATDPFRPALPRPDRRPLSPCAR